MRVDERLELADELGVASAGEVCVEAFFEGRQSKLLQPSSLDAREVLVELGERWPPPERERLVESTFCAQPLERRQVDGVRRDLERVTGALGDERAGGQHLSEPRDVDMNRLARRVR